MIELKGAFVALVTPFKENRVNEDKLKELVEFQISQGIDGIVPCGTTGESPTLSHEEHRKVVELVIRLVDGRVPVLAGTGSNSTREAIELTRHAKEMGADGALMITPYYNKPSQTGLLHHYFAVAEAVDIPIVVYNCPGRTSVNVEADTMVELAEKMAGRIIGAKEASGKLDQISEIIVRTKDDFTVMSGDDSHTLPVMSVGGKGVISVIANILPDKMHDMTTQFLAGDLTGALKTHQEIFLLAKNLMTVETNPSPVKAAMNLAGFDVGTVRLPLAEPSPAGSKRLEELMNKIEVKGIVPGL